MKNTCSHGENAHRLSSRILLCLTLILLLSCIFLAHPVVYAASAASGPGLGLAQGQLWTQGKGTLNQSAALMQAKNAHSINPRGIVKPLAAPPASYTLSTNGQSFKEPLAYGHQDASGATTSGTGAAYTDDYNWYLCGPGAAAVAMWFWPAAPFPGAGTYHDPHSSLYWITALGRPDIMYLAYGFTPPNSGWTVPGIMTYSTYPNADSANTDMVIGMNYEASGESSNWQGYFYVGVQPSNVTAASLLSDVEDDTYSKSVPLVVSVNDSYLPDWANSSYKGGSHDIAILGYNNSNSTYTYYETCADGAAGCETSGYGIYTISQATLYSAIENDNGNGAVIW